MSTRSDLIPSMPTADPPGPMQSKPYAQCQYPGCVSRFAVPNPCGHRALCTRGIATGPAPPGPAKTPGTMETLAGWVEG
jgi:hypothetical protein